MIKIEIKNRFTGKILFEFSKENNTVKDTVLEAIKNRADLRGANLYEADLRGADLRGADLRWADLRGADLRWADLRGADLRGADLRGANLYEANLRGADLRGAKNKNEASIPMFCKWGHAFKHGKLKIGCKEMSLEDWGKWFASDEEFETKRSTEEFAHIQAIFEACKAYDKVLTDFNNQINSNNE